MWDHIQSTLGRWPYRCDDCGLRFAAPYRYPEQADNAAENRFTEAPYRLPGPDLRAHAAKAEREAADMAFKTHVEKPHAKIVVQAETHEQLNQILLTLNRAVNSYQHASKAGKTTKTETESAGAAR